MSAGLERVKRKLRKHAAAAVDSGAKAAEREAKKLVSLMQSMAPADQQKLRKAIKVVKDPDKGMTGVLVVAGDATTIVKNKRGISFQNARLQEGGTKDMPANPYFNPARRMRAPQTRSAMKRAIKKGWLSGQKGEGGT